MKNFNVSVRLIGDPNWYSVSDVGFRFYKNHPSDGINYIKILTDDGIKETEDIFIEEVRMNVW